MLNQEQITHYQRQYDCAFPAAQQAFPEAIQLASQYLSSQGLNSYLLGAKRLCTMGLGVEPTLAYLTIAPQVAPVLGEDTLSQIADYAYQLATSPNHEAVVPFLTSLPYICQSPTLFRDLPHYLQLLDILTQQTDIHGRQSLYPSTGLVPLLQQIPALLKHLSLTGLQHFIQYGAAHYRQYPEQQRQYFQLQSHDAHSVLQRVRLGVGLQQIETQLALTQQALWQSDLPFIAFSTLLNLTPQTLPYLDKEVIALPDVYLEYNKINGLDRYRATLAHIMAHKKWSTPLVADNLSPNIRWLIATFEDARVDTLAMRRYPGLRPLFLALHPAPPLGGCDPTQQSCLYYRATRLSRALIDTQFSPEDALIMQFRQQFNALLAEGKSSNTATMQQLGLDYTMQSQCVTDRLPNLYVEHTVTHYRDDNRCLWLHNEARDEIEDVPTNEYQATFQDTSQPALVHYYDEWDYVSQSYRPDWVSLYEHLHPSGQALIIDQILNKYQHLAQQLKPQKSQRIRFQEQGNELDIDSAVRAWTDWRCHSQPNDRIHIHHTTVQRDLAVLLLVDLSNSLNETIVGTQQTLLQLSQEAIAITAWTMQQLGDPFAIAGFHSDTRKAVHYYHIKGFAESWDNASKARLAALDAAYSTRMGAALRHAAHDLAQQPNAKKLLLVLSDGEPSDIDIKDPQALIMDAQMAVRELQHQGVYSYCIHLDSQADTYVKTIFAGRYTIIDQVAQLPTKLPLVFTELTH